MRPAISIYEIEPCSNHLQYLYSIFKQSNQTVAFILKSQGANRIGIWELGVQQNRDFFLSLK